MKTLPEPQEGQPLRSGLKPRPLPEPRKGTPIKPESDNAALWDVAFCVAMGICFIALMLAALCFRL